MAERGFVAQRTTKWNSDGAFVAKQIWKPHPRMSARAKLIAGEKQQKVDLISSTAVSMSMLHPVLLAPAAPTSPPTNHRSPPRTRCPHLAPQRPQNDSASGACQAYRVCTRRWPDPPGAHDEPRQGAEKLLRPHPRRLAHPHQPPRPDEPHVRGDEGPHLEEAGGAVDGPVGFLERGGGGGHGALVYG
jgi:hypothetical protein